MASQTSPAFEDDDGLDSVTQSRVPAAGAAPISTVAPNSIFALGASAAGSSDEGIVDQIDHEERIALEAIAKEPCSNAQLRDLLAASETAVKRLMQRLRAGGKVELQGFGRSARWGLAKQGGVGWKPPAKAKPAAKKSPAAKTKAAPKKKTAAPVKAPTRAIAPVQPAVLVELPAEASDLECGLFNSGGISLAFAGQPEIRLSPARTRRLIDWLNKVDTVLRA